MATDLNQNTVQARPGIAIEVVAPVNAWPGAPNLIYVDVDRLIGGTRTASNTALRQTGFDPVTLRHWIRFKWWDGGTWSAWRTVTNGLTPPELLYGRHNGRYQVGLYFSIALNPTKIPLASQLAVKSGGPRQIQSVNIVQSGMVLLVNLKNPLTPQQPTTVSYTGPGMQSMDGIEVANFTDFAITP